MTPLTIRLALITVLGAGLAGPAHAQAASPANAVRAAAEQQLRAEPGVDARTRFVADSAELEPYLHCAPHPSGRQCRLTDSVPVLLVAVRMLRPDSAVVHIGRYELLTSRCPSGAPLDPPRVAIRQYQQRMMLLRDDRWVEVGRGVTVC